MTQLSAGDSLTTGDGQPLGRLRMAVGWEHTHTAGFAGSGAAPVDLDASAVQFAGGQFFDVAFFNNLATRDGSVEHLGDNTTGKGEGDDEAISVDLAKVYAKVDTILFPVTSYRGHSLEYVRNAYCRPVDDADVELARFTLTPGDPGDGRRHGQARAVRRRVAAARDRLGHRAEDADGLDRVAGAVRLRRRQLN
ncbi:TerD family protein [Nocardioides sp. B-3]|uniref:TerD family protein n=1 Tax=Nocardioides sp. B-3 TaxID=2895565 RepID=UPI0021521A25|nr:TerD family protein [Nocardioides sp. B-3]UUZ60698.1 TerD family protein [Nocardioides sp. B-3]